MSQDFNGFRVLDEDAKSLGWEQDVSGKLHKHADFLTRALVANDCPFVINVNSGWGTGKTFFLARWAKDLKKSHAVVFFNAWEADCADDPLLPLACAIKEQLRKQLPAHENVISRLASVGAQVAISSGIYALKAMAGPAAPIADGAVKGIAESWMEMEDTRIRARDGFRRCLTQLVAAIPDKKPVFILIDELDRCRPTFAIALLERIKHLFSIPNIKIIMATNTAELSKSIKAVYGAEFDADTYLQRFFNHTFNLPTVSSREFLKRHEALFANCLSIPPDKPVECLSTLSDAFGLSLRQQQQTINHLSIVIPNIKRDMNASMSGKPFPFPIHLLPLSLLVMMRIKSPKEYGQSQHTTEYYVHLNGVLKKLQTRKLPESFAEVIDFYIFLLGTNVENMQNRMAIPPSDDDADIFKRNIYYQLSFDREACLAHLQSYPDCIELVSGSLLED